MSKNAVRTAVFAIFNSHLPRRAELGNTGFRKAVIGEIMETFGCTLSSASTYYNTAFKQAKLETPELVAGLALSAVANHDLVGLIMFSDEPEKYIPPRKGKNNALAVLRDILYLQTKSSKTSIKAGCEYANKMLSKKCIIFVISDWLDEGYEHALSVLARKHDVVALQILDKSEWELPRAGILQLQDPESGEELWVNSSDEGLRKKYQQAVIKQNTEMQSFFRKNKCDYLLINTQEPYLNALQKFFRLRSKRRRR